MGLAFPFFFRINAMEVQINLNTVSGFIPKHWTRNNHMILSQLQKDITRNAIQSWQNRKEDEHKVRFLQVMSATHGAYFRFMNVQQKDEHTLLVTVD